MVQKLLNLLTRKPTSINYVTSTRVVKKAIEASMKDQKAMLESARKIKSS